MKCQHCDKEVFSNGYHDVEEFYKPELTPEQERDELFEDLVEFVKGIRLLPGPSEGGLVEQLRGLQDRIGEMEADHDL